MKLVLGKNMTTVCRYLQEINEIHYLAVRRLSDGEHRMLPELAELCEDIGNLYLNVSDKIREAVKETDRPDATSGLPQPGQASRRTPLSVNRAD